MKSKFTIKLTKPNQPQLFIFIIMIMPFLFGLFNLLSIPSYLKYGLDICWIGLLLSLFINREKFENIHKFLFIWVVLFFLYTLLVYILKYQSVLYYLWGFRNNFRFYIVFFGFIVFLRKKDVKFYLSLLDKIFWINSFVCFIQFFLFNISGDNLGGLFGTERGCNGYINIFFVIVATKSIIYYLNRKESMLGCLSKCGVIMIISAFAELKFVFLEFAVIVFLASLLTGFTMRKLFLTLGALLGIWLGINVLLGLFSNSADSFTWEGMLENASAEEGYSSSGDLNRLTTIPIISSKFFKSFTLKLVGLGLGNCDTSAFSFLNTPFFIENEGLRYNWFSSAFTFLETGYIGLIFFFGFYLVVFFSVLRLLKRTNEEKEFYQMGAIVAICCLLLGIYNSSLRMESAYMVYFVLAIPFILQKDKLYDDLT